MITATIKNSRNCPTPWGPAVMGEVYGDIRKRWPDGRLIRTSPIICIVWIPAQDGVALALTENSLYLLEA